MTYMSFTKDRFFWNFSFFADIGLFSDHISLVIPQEGPLWKQGRIDLFNAIPAIFSLVALSTSFGQLSGNLQSFGQLLGISATFATLSNLFLV